MILEFQPIESLVAAGKLDNEEFKHVVCFEPALEVLDWVRTGGGSVPIKPGGQIIIDTELDVAGFDQYEKFRTNDGYKNYLLREF